MSKTYQICLSGKSPFSLFCNSTMLPFRQQSLEIMFWKAAFTIIQLFHLQKKTSTMRCIRPWPLFATLLTLSTLLPVFAKDGEMQQRVPPHDVISRPVLHVKWGRWGSERTLEPPSKRTSEKSLNRPWRTLRSLFLQLTVPDMRIRRWFWWFVIKKPRKVI